MGSYQLNRHSRSVKTAVSSHSPTYFARGVGGLAEASAAILRGSEATMQPSATVAKELIAKLRPGL